MTEEPLSGEPNDVVVVEVERGKGRREGRTVVVMGGKQQKRGKERRGRFLHRLDKGKNWLLSRPE